MDPSIENIMSVAETLAAILTSDRDELYAGLSWLRLAWDESLIVDALEFLPAGDKTAFLQLIVNQNQDVSTRLSKILALSDEGLLLELAQIRLDRCRVILRAATKLLTPAEIVKLNKMVILQDIATNKTVDKPWEQKQPRPKPSRPAFSKELLAKTLIHS